MGFFGALRVLAVALGLSHPAGKTYTDGDAVEIDGSCRGRLVTLVIAIIALNDLLDVALDLQLVHTVDGLDSAEAPGYAAMLGISTLVSVTAGMGLKFCFQWAYEHASNPSNFVFFAFAEVAIFLVEDGTTLWIFRRVPGAYTGDTFDQANLLTTSISAAASLCALGYGTVHYFWIAGKFASSLGSKLGMTMLSFVMPAALVVFNVWVAVAQIYPGVDKVPLLTDLESPEGRGALSGFVLGYLFGIAGVSFVIFEFVENWGTIRTGAGKLYHRGLCQGAEI
jgi:hypothetical protein